MNILRLIFILGALFLLAACGDDSNNGVKKPALTISLAGTGVRGVETTIALPAGVTVSADATGATLDGVLKQSIGGANTQLSGKFTPAAAGVPATLHVILLSPDSVINSGDIATVAFTLEAGAAVPVAEDFTLENDSTTLSDINGAPVNGTLTLHL